MPLFEITSDDKDYPNSYKTLISVKKYESVKGLFNSRFPYRKITAITEVKEDGVIHDSMIVYHEE